VLLVGAGALWIARIESPATDVPSRPVPAALAALRLPDAERWPLRVLQDDVDDFLVLYPADHDPTDVAARWSLALAQSGYKRREDRSRPGRTVQRFESGYEVLLLAVGRTVEGPFVSLSRPVDIASHWAMAPDAEAPDALRALLRDDAREGDL